MTLSLQRVIVSATISIGFSAEVQAQSSQRESDKRQIVKKTMANRVFHATPVVRERNRAFCTAFFLDDFRSQGASSSSNRHLARCAATTRFSQ